MVIPQATRPIWLLLQGTTREVMTFGQEIGRVPPDGRIVGRAEPFAKVFRPAVS